MPNSTIKENKRVFASTGAIFVACAIAALLIAAIAAFATPEKAYAASFKSTSSTTNSITVTWDDPAGVVVTQNVVLYVDALDAKDPSKIKILSVPQGQRAYTINGLKPGTIYVIQIAYTTTTSTEPQAGPIASISTKVAKPTGVKQTKWSYKTSRADFTWDVQTGATQTQCKLINVATGKTVLDRTFSTLAKDFYVYGMSKNIMYAVQMRVKDANGWSPWSDKIYFLSQPLTNKKTKVAKNKLTVSWDKVKGAQKYAVYVSTKAKSGYKKIATVKSTKSSTTVKKFAGKKFSPKKTYYVYVQATKKVGGKTYTSGKHYAYKVKGAKASMVYPF